LITPEKFGADREEIRLALEKESIESRPIWPPARRAYASERNRCTCSRSFISKNARREAEEEQGARGIADSEGKRYNARLVGGEVGEDLFDRGLCLPSGTLMTEEGLHQIVTIIKNCPQTTKTKSPLSS